MLPVRFLLTSVLLALTLQAMPVHAQQEPPAPVVDLTPEQRRAYNEGVAEARRLIAEKQWGRAAAKLDALVKQRPREAQARFLKAVVQSEQGERAGAIATYQGLIDDYPEIPEPYNNLAVLLAAGGDIEGARINLETAVRTAPEWPTAHENLGDIYLRLAAEQYERAATPPRGSRTAPAKLKVVRDLLAGNAARP